MKFSVLVISKDQKFITDIINIKDSHKKIEVDIEILFAKEKTDAIEILKNDIMSLIILDSSVDNIINDQFVKQIRSSKFFDQKPIISLVSSYDEIKTKYESTNIILKPIDMDKLLDEIRKILAKEYVNQSLTSTMFNQTKQHKQEMSFLKDRMLLLFTHELKTPLNAIISFSDHINRGLQKKEISQKKIDSFIELSKLIKVNGEVLLNEITTLLNILKIREDKMHFSYENISLNQLIVNTTENYKLLYEKQINMSIKETFYKTDLNAFKHIFENLYSNALKYSNGKINISLEDFDDRFELIIEDDGKGIEEENKKTVFELFEQNEQNPLTRQREGTGIGLYIVKLLCEKLGYSISISDSTLGGAKFTLIGRR